MRALQAEKTSHFDAEETIKTLERDISGLRAEQTNLAAINASLESDRRSAAETVQKQRDVHEKECFLLQSKLSEAEAAIRRQQDSSAKETASFQSKLSAAAKRETQHTAIISGLQEERDSLGATKASLELNLQNAEMTILEHEAKAKRSSITEDGLQQQIKELNGQLGIEQEHNVKDITCSTNDLTEAITCVERAQLLSSESNRILGEAINVDKWETHRCEVEKSLQKVCERAKSGFFTVFNRSPTFAECKTKATTEATTNAERLNAAFSAVVRVVNMGSSARDLKATFENADRVSCELTGEKLQGRRFAEIHKAVEDMELVQKGHPQATTAAASRRRRWEVLDEKVRGFTEQVRGWKLEAYARRAETFIVAEKRKAVDGGAAMTLLADLKGLDGKAANAIRCEVRDSLAAKMVGAGAEGKDAFVMAFAEDDVWKRYSADVQKATELMDRLKEIKSIRLFCNWAVDTHDMYQTVCTMARDPPFPETLKSRLHESMRSGMSKLSSWGSDADVCDTKDAERIMEVAKSQADVMGVEKTVKILVWNFVESRRKEIMSSTEKDIDTLKDLGVLATECRSWPECTKQVNATMMILRSDEWAFGPDGCSVTHRMHVKPQQVGKRVGIQAHPLTNEPLEIDIPAVELLEDDDNTTSFSIADAGLYTRVEGSWEILRSKLQIHVTVDVPRRPWLGTVPPPGKEVREFGPEQKARMGEQHLAETTSGGGGGGGGDAMVADPAVGDSIDDIAEVPCAVCNLVPLAEIRQRCSLGSVGELQKSKLQKIGLKCNEWKHPDKGGCDRDKFDFVQTLVIDLLVGDNGEECSKRYDENGRIKSKGHLRAVYNGVCARVDRKKLEEGIHSLGGSEPRREDVRKWLEDFTTKASCVFDDNELLQAVLSAGLSPRTTEVTLVTLPRKPGDVAVHGDTEGIWSTKLPHMIPSDGFVDIKGGGAFSKDKKRGTLQGWRDDIHVAVRLPRQMVVRVNGEETALEPDPHGRWYDVVLHHRFSESERCSKFAFLHIVTPHEDALRVHIKHPLPKHIKLAGCGALYEIRGRSKRGDMTLFFE
jgi:hypothetical protein